MEEAQYRKHAELLLACADELLLPQGRKFDIDDNNKAVLRFLLYYFNNCNAALNVYGDDCGYSLDNSIILCGDVGVGKTLMMDVFAHYLNRIKSPRAYKTISLTQLVNWYKLHNNIDYFTYNTGNSLEWHPFDICINDIGLKSHKHYGVDTQMIVNEFFYARDEIYTQTGCRTHITTNLDYDEFMEMFDDGYGRLVDRFKKYNILALGGGSRR